LIQQVGATFGERDSQQRWVILFRRAHGEETGLLAQFFSMIDEGTQRGFQGHESI
jgi:hypothetical protein